MASIDTRVQIEVTRGTQRFTVRPDQFDTFPFEDGDALSVVPAQLAKTFPTTWGDVNLPLGDEGGIRVPPVYRFAEFRGFRIPHHLVTLTGAGPETLEGIGKNHIEHYRKHVGLSADMHIVEVGCGIGRDAFQLIDILSDEGRYLGIDVTRDSIVWCQRNITPRHPNFTFHHANAFNELYNPFGTPSARPPKLPVPDGSVDRIVLASVFTHLLADEVLAYLEEFRRVLRPGGLVYASFFLYSAEALQAAATKGNTGWRATFEHAYGGGVYGNDPFYPRGAVAYSDEAMRRLIDKSGLRLVRPYLKGWWSGLHGDQAEDGQDAAILALAT